MSYWVDLPAWAKEEKALAASTKDVPDEDAPGDPPGNPPGVKNDDAPAWLTGAEEAYAGEDEPELARAMGNGSQQYQPGGGKKKTKRQHRPTERASLNFPPCLKVCSI